MSFPIDSYDEVMTALRAVIVDRTAKGRNATNNFWEQFPHGNQDLTFEMNRRVKRILGAESIGDLQTVYGDTLDLANYAIFSLMWLRKNVTRLSLHDPGAAPVDQASTPLGYSQASASTDPETLLARNGSSHPFAHSLTPPLEGPSECGDCNQY